MTTDANRDSVPELRPRPARSRVISKWLLTVAVWLFAILAVATLYQGAENNFGVDFYQFWVGGDVVRAGRAQMRNPPADFYSLDTRRQLTRHYIQLARSHSARQQRAAANWPVLETFSSPFFYWLFSICAPGDYERVFRAYQLIALICLVTSISLLGWRMRFSVARTGAAVTLAAISAPVFSDFHVTNINCVGLFICTCYLLLRDSARQNGRRKFPTLLSAGALMGLLMAVKPTLLLSLGLLGFSGMISGRWRDVLVEATGFLAAVGGAIAMSSWRFGGIGIWIAWVRIVRSLSHVPSLPSGFGNFSLTETVYEYTGKDFLAGFSVVLISLALFTIWKARKCHRPSNDNYFFHDVTLFAMGTAITFLCNGLAWVHYPVLIFPFVMMLASPAFLGPIHTVADIGRPALLAFIILLLMAMIPPPKDILDLLSIHAPLANWLWIRCAQADFVMMLCLSVWCEISILPKFRHSSVR